MEQAGPRLRGKGHSSKPGQVLLCTQERALLSQGHSVPTTLPPSPPQDFLFLAPGGILGPALLPGPWRGRKMRVREEIKIQGYSLRFRLCLALG